MRPGRSSRIQLLDLVGGHYEHHILGSVETVEDVEQSRKRNVEACRGIVLLIPARCLLLHA